ncbi:MAG: hypothetical protein COB90_09455 [Hyphomicrobiales bacterium]|nr:MAG: hypothetical protein COB90_09455 [Hyphomicrobiales bacterium]
MIPQNCITQIDTPGVIMTNKICSGILIGASTLYACSAYAAGNSPQIENTDSGPLQIIISLSDQTVEVFRGDKIIATSNVSTGKQGHTTPMGVFSILEKKRKHRSNIYRNAPMPYMQRLTWSGIALHESRSVPAYPASHGCVRLPGAFAKTLFSMTSRGAHVVIAPRKIAPVSIEHANLFSPLNTPSAYYLTEEDLSGGPLADSILASALLVPGTASAIDRQIDKLVAIPVGKRKPLRILITRRNQRDLIRDAQLLLNELGYKAGEIDGLVGPATIRAIRKFREAEKNISKSGLITRKLITLLYKKAKKGAVPTGQLFVRLGFKPVFSAPVVIKNPEIPLGTHLLTVNAFDASTQSSTWLSLKLEDRIYPKTRARLGLVDNTPEITAQTTIASLDRIELSPKTRNRISRLLSPGSSLAISDKGISRETGLGTDFVVITNPLPVPKSS